MKIKEYLKKAKDWLVWFFDVEEEEHNSKFPKTCQCEGCKNKLSILSYRCPYCKKWHCETHRLPEDHLCKNPKLPSEMNKITWDTIKVENKNNSN